MKYSNYVAIGALIGFIATVKPFFGRTTIIPRSATVNAARSIAGWQEHINDYDVGRTYASFYCAPSYQRSFNNAQLVDFLLGGCDHIVVQGSRVPNRSSRSFLADYIGLPADFASCVWFKPNITSTIIDLNSYIGLDRCVSGLYMRIHAPVVHTTWDLGIEECIDVKGTDTHPAGYMGAQQVQRNELACSFKEAMTGMFCNHCKQQKPLVWGDVKHPLAFGRIMGRRHASRLSDVHITLGYNMFNGDRYHAGFNARISAPAGTQPDGTYFFEPIIGNGHHWELGVGWTSHWLFWLSEDELDFSGIWCDCNVTHMFADDQLRSYDFCGKPGSRYMLISQIQPIDDARVAIDGQAIEQQYMGRLFPAINKTTLCSRISMPIQVDLMVKVAYQMCGVQLDLGYGFWYRSAEKLHKRACFDSCYGLKGDAQLYGFVSQTAAPFTVDQPLALNATQHEATLCGGQGDGNFVPGADFVNANADNPAAATDSNGNPLNQLNQADSAFFDIAQQQVNASDGPVLLTDADIDIFSGLNPRAYSHKVFANVAYAWEHAEIRVVPFLGCGGEVEWRPDGNDNSAISQWQLWFKMGLSY